MSPTDLNNIAALKLFKTLELAGGTYLTRLKLLVVLGKTIMRVN